MKLLQNLKQSFKLFTNNLTTTSTFLLGAIALLLLVCLGVLIYAAF